MIPTLDFGTFLKGSFEERMDLAKTLVDGFKTHGFVKLINHGVNEEIIKKYQEASKRFFDLPLEEKRRIANTPGAHLQRGWSAKRTEQTGKLREKNMHGREGQDLLDEREFFDAGPPNDPLYPNKWPTRLLPDFQATMEKCYINLQEACLRIMSAIELGLGLEEGKLQARCEPAASEIRLNHYPAVNLSIINKGNLRRTWPHTDFGIITLLFQDLVGGLECEDREKKDAFLAIDPADPRGPSEMVVNISDTLERWTNGLIRAAVHQVDIPPSLKGVTEGMCPDRYSSIFFFKAHRDTSVGPLPEFVTDGRPARYEEITALQFQHQRSSRTRQLY